MMSATPRALIVAVVLAMLAASAAAIALAPSVVVEKPDGHLAELIPTTLGVWQSMESGAEQVSLFTVDEEGGNPMDRAYDDSLLRSYVDRDGHVIMLAIGYDRVQREEDRVHRPEICYIAQGFKILSDSSVSYNIASRPPLSIEGRRMLARSGPRLEAVSYWIRMGNTFAQNPWTSRAYVIREGLAGRLHDGILVRVSEIIRSDGDASGSYLRQEAFLNEMLQALAPAASHMLVGVDPPTNHDG